MHMCTRWVCLYLCVHVCVHVVMCVRACVHACVRAYLRACSDGWVYVCVRTLQIWVDKFYHFMIESLPRLGPWLGLLRSDDEMVLHIKVDQETYLPKGAITM